jgi:hypothetical protein
MSLQPGLLKGLLYFKYLPSQHLLFRFLSSGLGVGFGKLPD